MTRDVCIGVVLLVGVALATLVWNFYGRKAKQIDNANQYTSPQSSQRPESIYLELRSRALETSIGQIQEGTPTDALEVYGLVMDWDIGSGQITLVSFKTGDASLYMSSGGGVIGGIGHENVKRAAESLVRRAAQFQRMARKSSDVGVASEDKIKFFFLTPKGRFIAEEDIKNFENETSQWLELFVEANKLITELREVGELN